MNQWKQDIESKLAVLSSENEEARRNLESKYSDDLKNRLAAIQDKNFETSDRFEASIQKTQMELQAQIDSVEQKMREFSEKNRNDLAAATTNSDTYIKGTLKTYGERLNELLNKTLSDTESNLNKMSEDVQNRSEANSANIDAMVGDFNAWRTQLKQQFEETKALYGSQLGTIEESSKQKLEELQAEFIHNFEEFKRNSLGQQNQLSASIDLLKQKIDDSVKNYSEESARLADEQKKLYEDMLAQAKSRLNDQTENSDKAVREVKSQIQAMKDQISAVQADNVMKMQNDATDLQTRFSEIDRQVKAFAAQMQVYQKADELKVQLDTQISDLKDEIGKIENYKSVVNELENHFSNIQKINDGMDSKLARFNQEKNHIDSIEGKFNRLVSLSDSMDKKINELQTTSDDLQSLQLTVRGFQETLGEISGRYDRLEKKQDMIDQVNFQVDKTFDNLKDIESRLDNVTRQAQLLPDTITAIQEKVDFITNNTGKINDAVDKITNLNSLVSDAEKRIEQVQKSREGIATTETRLQNLQHEIDDKFEILADLTKKDIDENPSEPESSGRLTPKDRETIKQLTRMHWKPEEIARRMKRSISEIEMAIDMGLD